MSDQTRTLFDSHPDRVVRLIGLPVKAGLDALAGVAIAAAWGWQTAAIIVGAFTAVFALIRLGSVLTAGKP